jgi:heme-degrading monooxygenase HmoA
MRTWRAEAGSSGAEGYEDHFRSEVMPTLRKLAGFQGAYVGRRDAGEGVELVVVTLWASLDAVREFAGPNIDHAVVHPDAAAVLARWDQQVGHYDVIVNVST